MDFAFRCSPDPLMAKEVDDGAEVDRLLDQITGVSAVASFTGDGGYDQDRVYASVAEHSEPSRVSRRLFGLGQAAKVCASVCA